MNRRIVVLIGLIVAMGTILPPTASMEPLSFAGNSKSIVPWASAINYIGMGMGDGGSMGGGMSGNQSKSGMNQMNKTSGMQMQMVDDTANASIDKVITHQLGSNAFMSLVFVKYVGKLHINHIVINQTNTDVKFLKAGITHKWIPDIEGNSCTMHSNSAFMMHHGNKAMIVIKVLTDAMPAFTLFMAASHPGT